MKKGNLYKKGLTIFIILITIIVLAVGCSQKVDNEKKDITSSNNKQTDESIENTKENNNEKENNQQNQSEDIEENSIKLTPKMLVENDNEFKYHRDATFRELTLIDDKIWYIEDGYITTLDINSKEIKQLYKLKDASDDVYDSNDTIYLTKNNIWFYNYAYNSPQDMFYGLARYALNEDKIYEYSDKDFFKQNIRCIYELDDKTLISTYFSPTYQAYIFDLEDNSFKTFEHYLDDAIENSDYLWFADYGDGIMQINRRNDKEIKKFDTSNYLVNNYISKLFLLNNKLWAYWIDGRGVGLSVLDLDKGEWEHLKFNTLKEDGYSTVLKDNKGVLWIIGRNNLIKTNNTLDKEQWEVYRWNINNDSSFIEIQAVKIFGRNILVATNKGLVNIDSKSKEISVILEEDFIWSIIIAGDKIFAGTNNGIYEIEVD